MSSATYPSPASCGLAAPPSTGGRRHLLGPSTFAGAEGAESLGEIRGAEHVRAAHQDAWCLLC